MADLLDLLFIERQLSFRFSFLSVVCWSWHCCYILLLTAIIYTNTSHIAWEDSSVKPEKHIKPRSISGISPALCCSVYSCVLLCFDFGFWVLSVPGLAVCLLSPFLIQTQSTGWWFMLGTIPSVMTDPWIPPFVTYLVSLDMYRLWPSLVKHENLFSWDDIHSKTTTKIHLDDMQNGKLQAVR